MRHAVRRPGLRPPCIPRCLRSFSPQPGYALTRGWLAAARTEGRTLRFLANVEPVVVKKALDGLDPATTLAVAQVKTAGATVICDDASECDMVEYNPQVMKVTLPNYTEHSETWTIHQWMMIGFLLMTWELMKLLAQDLVVSGLKAGARYLRDKCRKNDECSPPATGGKVGCGPGYHTTRYRDARCRRWRDGATVTTVRRRGATVQKQDRVSGSRI